MSDRHDPGALADEIAVILPRLRRYGRALTGNQTTGDALSALAVEAAIDQAETLRQTQDIKTALFRLFHAAWQTALRQGTAQPEGLSRNVTRKLAELAPGTREAFLLHALEDFSASDIAAITGLDADTVARQVQTARGDLARAATGSVLVIEDEVISAMDLEAIASALGHEVIGNARTHREAVSIAEQKHPDLILADVHLADNSSGLDAVNEILQHFQVPVIFITGHPEQLLTGNRPEPSFLIVKPYSEDQVRSMISQAMFFASAARTPTLD